MRGNAQEPAVEVGSQSFVTRVQTSPLRPWDKFGFIEGLPGKRGDLRGGTLQAAEQGPSDLRRRAAGPDPDDWRATDICKGKRSSVPVEQELKETIHVREGEGSRACAVRLPSPSFPLLRVSSSSFLICFCSYC